MVKKPETQIEKATCDWCGIEFPKETIKMEGYGEVNIFFGYGSKYDEDEKWIGEICDECFEKHLKPKMRKSGE